jgi:general secretion pathway protein F
MPQFIVEAAASDGRRVEQLLLEARDGDDAARQARAQGRYPVRVRLAGVQWHAALLQLVRRAARLSLADLALFAEQLAQLLQAGVPLEQALSLLARTAPQRTQSPTASVSADLPATPTSALSDGAADAAAPGGHGEPSERGLVSLAQRLLVRVREGVSLSSALRAEPAVPASFAGVVHGSEEAGTLADGLAALAGSVQRQVDTRQRVRAALAYPVALAVVALAAVLFVLTAVIPEFAPLFEGEQHRLPLLTRGVLWLSDLVNGRLLLLLLLVAAVALAIWGAWRRWPALRQTVWRQIRRLPPVRYAMRLDLAQALRVMGSLLQGGMETSAAMQLTAQSATFTEIRLAFEGGARQLRAGAALSQVCAALPGLPDTALTVLMVGERAGEAGAAALRAAQWLDQDTQRRMAALLALVNPLAVIAMGALVALLIAAIMVGILSINQLTFR